MINPFQLLSNLVTLLDSSIKPVFPIVWNLILLSLDSLSRITSTLPYYLLRNNFYQY